MDMVSLSTNDDKFSDALGRVTECILLGRYDDASDALNICLSEEVLSPRQAMLLSQAAARIYIARGYPQAAKDELHRTIVTYSTKMTPDERLELDCHFAYCSIVGCGELQEAYPAVGEVQSRLNCVTLDQLDSGMIELQIFLDKILLLKQTLNQPRSRDVRPSVADRARALTRLAEHRKHYVDLWRSSIVFCMTAPDTEVLQWLEASICYDWVPDAVRAQFQLEAAQKLLGVGRLQEAEEFLAAAAVSFQRCNHAFGQTEVRRLRVHHGLEKCANPLKELVDIVSNYCTADFPYGVLYAASAPLGLAFAQSNLGVYVSLQECLHAVCKVAGIAHERLLLEIQLLATMNANTGHFAIVVGLGRDLYEQCNRLQYSTMSWLVGRILSLAYHSRRQHADSLRYAKEVLAICQKHELQATSEAAYHLAFIRDGQRSSVIAQRVLETNLIIDELLPTVEEDHHLGESKLACDKLLLILGLQNEQARLNTNSYIQLSEVASATTARIETISKTLPVPENVQVESACKEQRITQLLFEAKRSGDQGKATEAIDLCTGLIEGYTKVGLQYHAAMKYQFRSLCHTQLYQIEPDFQTRLKHLVAAEADLEKASQAFIVISSLQQVLVARHAQARIHVTAWETVNTPVDDVLQNLLVLERVADGLRRELSAFGSLSALMQKQIFSATSELQDLYRWAIAVTILSRRPSDLFVWSQKRKARSLSEVLGLGVLVPMNAQRGDGLDGHVHGLFEQLQILNTAILTCPANEQVYLRQRIEDIETQLRHCSQQAVRDFLILRDGDVQSMKEVSELGAKVPAAGAARNTVFADYVVCGNDIYVITLSIPEPEKTCRLHKLTITIGEAQDWMRTNFGSEDTRKQILRQDANDDPSKPMRTLDALVAPLKSVTEPGDLLLLSVTSVIASIPLHALTIEDGSGDHVPLIQRNPIVYIPSLPIGKVCLNRWRENASQQGKAVFFGNYDKPGEADRIYAQMARLAQNGGGQSFCGDYATKATYKNQVANATLIHQHLHCRFSADNILKQALVLAKEPDTNPKAAPNPDAYGRHHNEQRSSDRDAILRSLQTAEADAQSELLLSSSDPKASTHVTVEEIFKLQLSSPLVVLIACESSSQTFSEGDEPLGLVTGFLCAGAASVIGASWRIPSGAGRRFSDVFYEQMRSVSDGNVVDLAVALQEAVLTIKDDTTMSETYYWGGFCLYGSWLFRPPWLAEDD